MIKQSIESDLKTAMLAGDKETVSVLRTIKSVILDGEVQAGKRDTGLDDEVIIPLLQKEVKKRLEASELYKSAGDDVRANKEKFETTVISKYLPEMIGEDEIRTLVSEVIAGMGDVSMQNMGQVIGAVKSKTGARADGAVIAKIVKETITQ